MVPGRKFSTSTSAVAIKRHSTSFPAGARISSAMPNLLRFIAMNAADSPLKYGGAMRRESSPPRGFSILITSAPRSASNIAQNGPAMICVKSNTRIPSRAAGKDVPSFFVGRLVLKLPNALIVYYEKDTFIDCQGGDKPAPLPCDGAVAGFV